MGSFPQSQWIRGLLAQKVGGLLGKNVCWCILVLLTACAPQKAPHLLELDSLGPETVEEGTELRVTGTGFPERRPGTLHLLGTVYTPARVPRKVHWRFPVIADSRSLVTLRVERKSLTKHLQDAAHVTFVGRAELSFSPLLEGRPALSGESEALTIDFFSGDSGRRASDWEARAELAAGFSQFLGLELGPDLIVRQVTEDGLAAHAGLQVGDQLHRLDQVRLDSLADFAPQARARASSIEYFRKGFDQANVAYVPRATFQVLDPDVASRALAVFGALTLALCLAARPPRFLIWLATKKSKKLATGPELLTDLSHKHQLLAYPGLLGVVLFYGWILGWPSPELSHFDFVICVASAMGSLLVGAFLLGGFRSKVGNFSFLGAFANSTAQMLSLFPLLVAFLFRASEVGTLRLTELTEVQGPWPSQWGLVDSPWSFLLALSALFSLIPVSGRRPPLEGHRTASGSLATAGRVFEWMGQLTFLGLWVAVFAGGLRSSAQSQVWATVIFCAKFLLSVQALSIVRAHTGRVRLGEAGPLSGRLSWALAVAAATLGALQFFRGGSVLHHGWLQVFSLSLGAALLALGIVSVARSWAHTGRRSDPWI